MSLRQQELPSIAELRRLVKKRERPRWAAMYYIEPIQVYFSYALIRLGLNPTHVTVMWLCVALASYGVNTVGAPWAFAVAAVLYFVKIMLDGSDGEVARYDKQFVSAERDIESFIHGVYLDKVFHAIEKPLWGLSLGLGLYRMHGDARLFIPAVAISVLHAFYRHERTVRLHLPMQFAERIASVRAKGGFATLAVADSSRRETLLVRLVDSAGMWVRNGKRFNLLILLSALWDCSVLLWGGPPLATVAVVVGAGILSPLLVVIEIRRTISSKMLIERALEIADRR